MPPPRNAFCHYSNSSRVGDYQDLPSHYHQHRKYNHHPSYSLRILRGLRIPNSHFLRSTRILGTLGPRLLSLVDQIHHLRGNLKQIQCYQCSGRSHLNLHSGHHYPPRAHHRMQYSGDTLSSFSLLEKGSGLRIWSVFS